MGHLMSTVNQEAAERDLRPLPKVGHTVLYRPRSGDIRRGRAHVPALVVRVDEDNRRLDLIVFNEAHDSVDQESVPEQVGEDRGWARLAPDIAVTKIHHDVAELAAIKGEIASLRQLVLGEFEEPPESIVALLDAMDERVGKIEDAAGTYAAKAAKPKAAKPEPVERKRRFGRG